MNYPEDMIGAIKIKDGLFIGDSFAAQVSDQNSTWRLIVFVLLILGPRIRSCQQGYTYYQLCW